MKKFQDPVVQEDRHVEGLEVPEVTWYRHPGLRRLYIMMPIVFLGMNMAGYKIAFLTACRLHLQWLRWLPSQWTADHGPMAKLYAA